MARGLLAGLLFGVLVAGLMLAVAALQLEQRRGMAWPVMEPPQPVVDWAPSAALPGHPAVAVAWRPAGDVLKAAPRPRLHPEPVLQALPAGLPVPGQALPEVATGQGGGSPVLSVAGASADAASTGTTAAEAVLALRLTPPHPGPEPLPPRPEPPSPVPPALLPPGTDAPARGEAVLALSPGTPDLPRAAAPVPGRVVPRSDVAAAPAAQLAPDAPDAPPRPAALPVLPATELGVPEAAQPDGPPDLPLAPVSPAVARGVEIAALPGAVAVPAPDRPAALPRVAAPAPPRTPALPPEPVLTPAAPARAAGLAAGTGAPETAIAPASVPDPVPPAAPPADLAPVPGPEALIGTPAPRAAASRSGAAPLIALVLDAPQGADAGLPAWAQSLALAGDDLDDPRTLREVMAELPPGADRGALARLAWSVSALPRPGPVLVAGALAHDGATAELAGMLAAAGLGAVVSGGGTDHLDALRDAALDVAAAYPDLPLPERLARAAVHARRDGAAIVLVTDGAGARQAVSDFLAAEGADLTPVTATEALLRLTRP